MHAVSPDSMRALLRHHRRRVASPRYGVNKIVLGHDVVAINEDVRSPTSFRRGARASHPGLCACSEAAPPSPAHVAGNIPRTPAARDGARCQSGEWPGPGAVVLPPPQCSSLPPTRLQFREESIAARRAVRRTILRWSACPGYRVIPAAVSQSPRGPARPARQVPA